ncbi:MAG: hypothetical protein ACI4JN_09675, partial [Ruminococcus sp.]
ISPHCGESPLPFQGRLFWLRFSLYSIFWLQVKFQQSAKKAELNASPERGGGPFRRNGGGVFKVEGFTPERWREFESRAVKKLLPITRFSHKNHLPHLQFIIYYVIIQNVLLLPFCIMKG